MDLTNLPVEFRRHPTSREDQVVTWSPHPFNPSRERQLLGHFLPNETIAQYLVRVELDQEFLNRPVLCTINGLFVPRSLWTRTYPKTGTIIRFYATVSGGGGGDGDKNPLRTVLTIAVMVAALEVGGWVGNASWGGKIWGAVAAAAVSFVGGLAINALFPPPQLKTPNGSDLNISPTYSLSGGNNRARPYEPIPVMMGTYRVFPDLGAKTYTEFRSKEQYLMQLFDFGYNDVDLTSFRIGDTDLSAYSGVELEVSGPDGAITMFPGNVDTVAGAALTFAAGWILRTSSVDATSLAIEIDGALFLVNNDGTLGSHTVVLQMQYSPAGAGTWTDLTFESDAAPSYPTTSNGFLSGIVRVAADVWANQYSVTSGQVRLVNNTRDPLRRTFVFNVSKGQYDVRVMRVTADDVDTQHTSDISWTQLRTYQPDTADYTGRKRVALRIKASGQLSGIVDQFSAIATAKCPTYGEGYEINLNNQNLVAGDGVQIPDASQLSTSSVWVEFWYELTGTLDVDANNNWRSMIRKSSTASGATSGWDVVQEEAGGINWDTGHGATDRLAGAIGATIGTRMLLGFTYDATTGVKKVYKNGVAIANHTAPAGGITANAIDLFVGYGTNHVTNPNGSGDCPAKYDGLRVYNRVPYSDGEVLEHYSGVYKDDTGLVGKWEFDEGSGTTITDSSGYGNDGTLLGSPTFDASPATWGTRATSNPAWWFQQVLAGKYASSLRRWGAGLALGRIDVAQIADFAAWCDAQNLTFNGVFDQPISVLDMLGAIALCGRGTVSWANGLYGVIWDADNQPKVGVFNMANIELNTFNLSYQQDNLADEIVVDFNDAAMDYQQNSVRVVVPGVTNPTNTRSIQLLGCTNATMAGQLANLYAATNLYRTRKYRWICDFEGMPASRGDVIQLSHDLASFDYSGRLGLGGTSSSIVLDRQVPLPSVVGYITIVQPDGTTSTHTVNSGSGSSNTLMLVTALSFNPWADANHPPHDYKWIYGQSSTTPGRLVKIDSMTPQDETHVEVTAIDEDPNFYAAKDNLYNYVAPSTIYGGAPTIESLALQEGGIPLHSGGYAVEVTVTWQASGNFTYADIRVQVNDGPLELKGVQVRDNQFKFQVEDKVNLTVELTAYGNLGDLGQSTKQTINQSIDFASLEPPSDVTDFTAVVVGSQVELTWDDVPDLDLKQYKVYRGTYGTGTLVYRGRSTKAYDTGLAAGTYNYYIKAQDVADLESVNTTTAGVTISLAGAPLVTASISGADYILKWTQPISTLPIEEYEIRYGASWAGGTSLGTVKGSTFKAPANWVGTRSFWIAGINTAGDVGGAGNVDIVITAPSMPTVTAQTLDNNVLLYWSDASQTLPITSYEVRRGATYASSTLVGTKQGWFTSVFETAGGSYTYWITGIDSAGNYGAHGSVSLTVSSPPDYILNTDWISTLSDTFSSAYKEADGSVTLPVNITETWADHFVNNAWATPQAQIDAGYTAYIEPSQASGYYEETFDYGTSLASTKITVIPTYATVAGTPGVQVDIWISSTGTFGGTPDFPNTMEAYATNFRYVKVRFTVTSVGGDDLVSLTGLEVRLDSKLRTDQGVATANSADVGGTSISFNLAFVSVVSINGTPQGTAELKPVIDFTSVPNPTSFKLYLFDATGSRASGDVYWTSRGY